MSGSQFDIPGSWKIDIQNSFREYSFPVSSEKIRMMLRVYRERFLEVEVALRELTTQEQLRVLEEEYIQVRLPRLPIGAPMVYVEVVRWEPIVCVLPEEHPLASHERVPVSLLADEPFVLQSSHRGEAITFS